MARPYTLRGALTEAFMEIASQAALCLALIATYLITDREHGELLSAVAVVETEAATIRRLLTEQSRAA